MDAGTAVLARVEGGVEALRVRHERLARDVLGKWAEAEKVKVLGERVLAVGGVAERVARVVALARRVVGEVREVEGAEGDGGGGGMKGRSGGGGGDYRAMVRAAGTVVSLRGVLGGGGLEKKGMELEMEKELERVEVVRVLKEKVVAPREARIVALAQKTIREFAMSSLAANTLNTAANTATTTSTTANMGTSSDSTLTGFAQVEETRSRMTAALATLYLLSPLTTPLSTSSSLRDTSTPATVSAAEYKPALLLSALQAYLQTALTASLAALTRSLATLPTLERTLVEISARCQNIVALEQLLRSTRPPVHPLLSTLKNQRGNTITTQKNDASSDSEPSSSSSDDDDSNSLSSSSSSSSTSPSPPTTTPTNHTTKPPPPNYITPLLSHLDTSSLPSFFWRSLASALSGRVREIMSRGGVSARTLRSSRERIREALRRCVHEGSRLPDESRWERVADGAETKEAGVVESWEREAAVMVGAVVGVIGR